MSESLWYSDAFRRYGNEILGLNGLRGKRISHFWEFLRGLFCIYLRNPVWDRVFKNRPNKTF